MRREIRQDIRNLQNEILQLEQKLLEQSRVGYDSGLRKTKSKIESDLKYLSILANGAPIDKNEDRKIMDFLRVHYEKLRKISIPV